MFLPETRDQPLPDTLQDAVTILKDSERPYQCGGFGAKFLGGKYSISATELMQQQQQQQSETEREADDAEGTNSTCGMDDADDDDGEEQGESESRVPGRTSTTGSRKRSDAGGAEQQTTTMLPAIPEERSQRCRTSDDVEDAAGDTNKTESPSMLLTLSSESEAEHEEAFPEAVSPARVRHRAGADREAKECLNLSAEFGTSQHELLQAIKQVCKMQIQV